MDNITMLLLTH